MPRSRCISRPWLIVAFVGVAVGCTTKERPPALQAQEDPEPDIPYERLPATGDAFQEQECDSQVEGYASQCGFVVVRETEASESKVELLVRRVFSNGPAVLPDPIVYLNGGPGAATVADAGTYAEVFQSLLEKRDLILIDQRGTGGSKPALTCTEDGPIDTALETCFARLSKTVELASYTTASNARDVERVREAFAYPQWNLLGISYGTRLALTLARDFPGGIRSSVLDSVVPLEADLIADVGLNGQAALRKTFMACQLDVDCAMRYPDPLLELKGVVESLNEKAETTGTVSGDDFVEILYDLQYSPRGVGLIPYLIKQAAEGRFDTFDRVSEALTQSDFAIGMHLSVQCAEEVPFTSAERVRESDLQVASELRKPLSGIEYLSYCQQWPVPQAPVRENEPATNDIPSLVLSGAFDPITPPRYARAVADKLGKAQYFDFPNESHGVSAGECGISVVSAFLDEPNTAVRAACREAPGLSFKASPQRLPAPTFDPLDAAAARPLGRPRFVTTGPTQEGIMEIVHDVQLRRGF